MQQVICTWYTYSINVLRKTSVCFLLLLVKKMEYLVTMETYKPDGLQTPVVSVITVTSSTSSLS